MTTTVPQGPSHPRGGPAPFDVDDYLADMGDRIRAERHARGWSTRHLALRAATSKGTVLGIESGRIGATFALVIRLSHALGMTVGQLLADDWVMPARAVKGPSLTPLQREVLLLAAETGLSLSELGRRLGRSTQAVSAVLSQAYRSLDVPQQDDRRMVALRVAREHGLIPAAGSHAA